MCNFVFQNPKSSSQHQLPTTASGTKVPTGSGSSSNMSSSKSAHNLSSEGDHLRAQWHHHHVKLAAAAAASRSSSMPRHPHHPHPHQESYEYLPGMMRPGSRVGIAADLGSTTPDYDVIQRLQQRPAPPPPPPQAMQNPYQVQYQHKERPFTTTLVPLVPLPPTNFYVPFCSI